MWRNIFYCITINDPDVFFPKPTAIYVMNGCTKSIGGELDVMRDFLKEVCTVTSLLLGAEKWP